MDWVKQIKQNCDKLEGGCLKYKFRPEEAPRLSIWFDYPHSYTLENVYIPKIMYFFSKKGTSVESIEDLLLTRTCKTKHCCNPDHYRIKASVEFQE